MNSNCMCLDNREGVGVPMRDKELENHWKCRTTKTSYGSTKCSKVKLYNRRRLLLSLLTRKHLMGDTWNNLLDLWT